MQLEGFANDQVVVARLGANITAADTTLTTTSSAFSDGSGMSPGVWEIDDELVFVTDFNRSTGAASVVRGWHGSTAAPHTANALIRNNPRFPLIQVKRAVNDAISNLFPAVPAVKTSDFTALSNKVRYPLPSDARGVLDVSMRAGLTDDDAWETVRMWRFFPRPGGDYSASTVIEFPTAYTGVDTHVVYVAEPSPLTSDSDDFETVTGLPSFAREAVVWGAMYRMYSMVELGRGGFSSADQTMLNTGDSFGKPTDIAKFLYGMYQQAVLDAQARMQDLYPASKHYVW